ncbi:MobA-like NTP transferase domain-containing protein [Abditibacterium utsteinense]|uniref:MobA-like NTP transferase domain-containing protein n=1 Tax=Abditibacterium utsteinense TaxID=1960156 RepID=A0A2S8SV35_9BACT|nr:NTP transferase domain-containing protein [Abditibacterium utsteinense]PQV64644.1 MobA-like NTP transferase domain-containing protein [Abditibacterium utsteinense]
MEAVVLAGGKMPVSLQGVAGATERALIEIEGRTLLNCVLDSLRETTPITRIICVATPDALASLGSDIVGIAAGDKMSGNLFLGAREAKSERILVVTADAPLVTGRTWMQFLDGAAVNLLQAAYPIVRRENVEEQFPGGKRTYATLAEGTFTGGNAFLLPKNRLEEIEPLINQAFENRKNPLALARMLGAKFIFRALTKKLTVGEVESKISGFLGCHSGAVIIPDASIAFDVDKAEDLKTAREVAAQRKLLVAQSAQNAQNSL